MNSSSISPRITSGLISVDVADEAEFGVAGDRPDEAGVDSTDPRRHTARGR